MYKLALMLTVSLVCAKQYTCDSIGLTVDYPDHWRIIENTAGGNLCTLFPVSDQSVVINISTDGRKRKELSHYQSGKGRETLRLSLLRKFNRLVQRVKMKEFALVNDEKGLGYETWLQLERKGHSCVAYQRGFLSIVDYFVVTLTTSADRENELLAIFNQIEVLYPKIAHEITWERK